MASSSEPNNDAELGDNIRRLSRRLGEAHTAPQADAGVAEPQLRDKAFRLALDKTKAQLGAVRNELLAAQANYRNMQAQFEQAQNDVTYYDTTFKRQQALAANSFASQAAFDDARRNFQVAQQKL